MHMMQIYLCFISIHFTKFALSKASFMTIYLIDFNMTFNNSTDLMILTEKP